MLKVQRLRIIIHTEKGQYGFDHVFKSGLNIIASNNNTSGKSAIINSLYYVLGFEQLIEGTGTGSKTLSQALTKQIRIDDDVNGEELPVIESEILAELSNGKRVITVKRFAKHAYKKDNLVIVYDSSIDEMFLDTTSVEEMYVLMPGAASNEQGFHKFLEEFLEMDLPIVTSTNGTESKLYLQAVFGALFIEQKHGWGGFLNGVPYLAIAEVKKRIVEYIIGLSTLENEKLRRKLKKEADSISNEWKNNITVLEQLAKLDGINVEKLPISPTLSVSEIDAISWSKENLTLQNYIEKQKELSSSLISDEPVLNAENREKIEIELRKVQADIADKQIELERIRSIQKTAKIRYYKSKSSLEIIQTDLLNNKEAKRLRELGAEQGIKDFDHLCPTCGQKINDSLLNDQTVMSIDENINHLQNQEALFKYSIQAQHKALLNIDNNIDILGKQILNLKKLESILYGDLAKVKGDYSYSMAYKKVRIDSEIDRLEHAVKNLEGVITNFYVLADRWKECMAKKAKIGNKIISEKDSIVLKNLGKKFAELLRYFGFRSSQHFDEIKISEDSFLPTINGFDMRYDSSASDELRNIWSFSLALMEISMANNGNHPRIIIFDEPKQQSVVDQSFKALCNKLIDQGDNAQIIIGVTAFDDGVKRVINELDRESFELINIGNRAFKELD